MQAKLIFIEGLPGSGKTTMSGKLYESLRQICNNVKVYLEGDLPNPINFSGFACLNHKEFDYICNKYKDINFNNALWGKDYVLVPYAVFKTRFKETEKYNTELQSFLRTKEFCYKPSSPISINRYKEIMTDRWYQFIKNVMPSDVKIFDGDFFQHPIDDMLYNYNASIKQVIDYLLNIGDIIKNINSKLFYISQNNIEDSLSRIAEERKQYIYTDPKMIRHWKKRKIIEFKAMSKLSLHSCVIDNSNYDWDNVFSTITNSIYNVGNINR